MMHNEPDKRVRKWARNPEDPDYSDELLLPSFGIRVTRSEPFMVIRPPGVQDSPYEILSPDSADAFSVSYLATKGRVTVADQRFLPLDPAYLRRILLRVLDGEEMWDVQEYHNALKWRETPPRFSKGQGFRDIRIARVPDPTAPVRITDLRLATEMKYEDLKDRMRSDLRSLELPVGKESVTRWKWEKLKSPASFLKDPSKLTEAQQAKYETDVAAVSFAAAALLLLHDLDMRNVKEGSKADVNVSNVVGSVFWLRGRPS